MADHPLAGPVYTGTVIRTPKRMLTGSGAPSFCWQCGNQLQRAPGKGAGLFFFNLVIGPDGEQHRIHGDCTERAILDGCKLCSASGVAPTRRFDDDWAPNPNDDHGADRPTDPEDDLTPGADPTDRAGVPGTHETKEN